MYSSGGVDTFICQLRSGGEIGSIEDGGRSVCTACSWFVMQRMARRNDSVCMVDSHFTMRAGDEYKGRQGNQKFGCT
jgi:hypothetical protein